MENEEHLWILEMPKITSKIGSPSTSIVIYMNIQRKIAKN